MIKIVSDSQIPNIEQNLTEFFADEYSLEYFASDELTSNRLRDVDALLVRSTIQVDKELCDHSSIKFIGSATCLLYTSDAADDTPCVDLGGRRII